MKNFIVYNSHGEILRIGYCQDSTFLHQAGKDEFVMEGSANDVKQKIINGKIINRIPEEIK